MATKIHEKGILTSLMQLFSAFIHRNAVEAAVLQESALFDSMLEELRSSSSSIENTPIDSDSPKFAHLSKFHLILDIDGTLVHTMAHDGFFEGPDYEDLDLRLCSYKRPGLDDFIEFCFTHFQSVSLWTAGTQEYAEFIAKSIAPPGYQFLFILTRIHCKDHPFIEGTLVKDMNDLWASEIAQTFQLNESNSIIIDDNEDYCSANPRNAIVVKTWKYLHASDFTLPTLQNYLENADTSTVSSICWGATCTI